MAFISPLAAVALSQPSLPVVGPVLILLLCVAGGIGTTLLLPGHGQAGIRKVGGAALVAVGLVFLVSFTALGTGVPDAVYFWLFAIVAIGSAVRVVTHPKPVYSALYFVLTVFASAGLFVLLQAEFMAAALVLIYAGAILVTYVFVIMLASQATSSAPDSGPLQGVAGYDIHSRDPGVAAAIGFATMGVLLIVILTRAPAAMTTGAANMPTVDGGPTQALGTFLFRSQLVQLEVAGIILLVSMVGAIVITRRQVLVLPKPGETRAGAMAGSWEPADVVSNPATPIDDNPHSIPVFGTRDNPRQKAYPQT
jgi:NADH-quinone oxidoreductase subunit J